MYRFSYWVLRIVFYLRRPYIPARMSALWSWFYGVKFYLRYVLALDLAVGTMFVCNRTLNAIGRIV